MKIPSSKDIVLMLLGLSGEREFKGTTNIQKNIYLLQEMLKSKDINMQVYYKPYFYGPYSAEITEAIERLEIFNLVKIVEHSRPSDSPFEGKVFIYELTEEGKSFTEELLEVHKEFTKLFSFYLDKIKQNNFHQNTKILSIASKIKYILSNQERPLNYKKIMTEADGLGWKLKQNEITRAADFLVNIGLASKTKS